MKRIRVLVADDSALMRQTLKRIIAASADLDLVGLARDGEDAVAKMTGGLSRRIHHGEFTLRRTSQ